MEPMSGHAPPKLTISTEYAFRRLTAPPTSRAGLEEGGVINKNGQLVSVKQVALRDSEGPSFPVAMLSQYMRCIFIPFGQLTAVFQT